MIEPRKPTSTETFKRSLFGAIAVYDLLPDEIVQQVSVRDFQREVQELLQLRTGYRTWVDTFSPRVLLYEHALA